MRRDRNVYHNVKLGSLSSNVFERRTSTGSGLFSFFDGGFAQIFSQIASITVKKLRNTNFISSRHVKRENTSLPVDVRRSKTSLLKLPIVTVWILLIINGLSTYSPHRQSSWTLPLKVHERSIIKWNFCFLRHRVSTLNGRLGNCSLEFRFY